MDKEVTNLPYPSNAAPADVPHARTIQFQELMTTPDATPGLVEKILEKARSGSYNNCTQVESPYSSGYRFGDLDISNHNFGKFIMQSETEMESLNDDGYLSAVMGKIQTGMGALNMEGDVELLKLWSSLDQSTSVQSESYFNCNVSAVSNDQYGRMFRAGCSCGLLD